MRQLQFKHVRILFRGLFKYSPNRSFFFPRHRVKHLGVLLNVV